MSISLIIGNGFSIDAENHFGLDYSASKPWGWDLINPYNKKEKLLDAFPRLKNHLLSKGNLDSIDIYESLRDIVKETQSIPIYNRGVKPSDEYLIHCEACHHLRIAFSWYSRKIGTKDFSKWTWFQWFKNNINYIQTILTYNYDLIIEQVIRQCQYGIAYSGSLVSHPLRFLPPKAYCEKSDLSKVIHIAKIHGSCNFTGWAFQRTQKDGKTLPLYPLNSFLVRDNSLKIIPDNQLLEPTSSADIVLPGEWSCWNKSNIARLEWAQIQLDTFIEESKHSEVLMIVGFGFGDPDKKEFQNLTSKLPKFEKTIIVDPNPNQDLIQLITNKTKSQILIVPSVSDL